MLSLVQWVLLRNFLPRACLWFLATGAGVLLGGLVTGLAILGSSAQKLGSLLDPGSFAAAGWPGARPGAVALFTALPAKRFLDHLRRCSGSWIDPGGWKDLYQPGRTGGLRPSGGNYRAGAVAPFGPCSAQDVQPGADGSQAGKMAGPCLASLGLGWGWRCWFHCFLGAFGPMQLPN